MGNITALKMAKDNPLKNSAVKKTEAALPIAVKNIQMAAKKIEIRMKGKRLLHLSMITPTGIWIRTITIP